MTLSAAPPRWKDRLESFSRALARLRDAVEDMNLREFSLLEREGVIQRFEFTWELAWKMIADYLKSESAAPKIVSAPSVIRTALEQGIIEDGDGWMNALKARNITTHTYDREAAAQISRDVQTIYFGLLHDLENWFKAERDKDGS